MKHGRWYSVANISPAAGVARKERGVRWRWWCVVCRATNNVIYYQWNRRGVARPFTRISQPEANQPQRTSLLLPTMIFKIVYRVCNKLCLYAQKVAYITGAYRFFFCLSVSNWFARKPWVVYSWGQNKYDRMFALHTNRSFPLFMRTSVYWQIFFIKWINQLRIESILVFRFYDNVCCYPCYFFNECRKL